MNSRRVDSDGFKKGFDKLFMGNKVASSKAIGSRNYYTLTGLEKVKGNIFTVFWRSWFRKDDRIANAIIAELRVKVNDPDFRMTSGQVRELEKKVNAFIINQLRLSKTKKETYMTLVNQIISPVREVIELAEGLAAEDKVRAITRAQTAYQASLGSFSINNPLLIASANALSTQLATKGSSTLTEHVAKREGELTKLESEKDRLAEEKSSLTSKQDNTKQKIGELKSQEDALVKGWGAVFQRLIQQEQAVIDNITCGLSRGNDDKNKETINRELMALLNATYLAIAGKSKSREEREAIVKPIKDAVLCLNGYMEGKKRYESAKEKLELALAKGDADKVSNRIEPMLAAFEKLKDSAVALAASLSEISDENFRATLQRDCGVAEELFTNDHGDVVSSTKDSAGKSRRHSAAVSLLEQTVGEVRTMVATNNKKISGIKTQIGHQESYLNELIKSLDQNKTAIAKNQVKINQLEAEITAFNDGVELLKKAILDLTSAQDSGGARFRPIIQAYVNLCHLKGEKPNAQVIFDKLQEALPVLKAVEKEVREQIIANITAALAVTTPNTTPPGNAT